jgi:integrase
MRESDFCALASSTGCRLGELLALQWADVDEKNALLHIRATLTRDKAGAWVATPPKTATSTRTIKLPSNGVELLKALHKASLNSEVGSHWVFHRKDGKPLGRDGYVRCELKKIATAIGKPGFSSHSLRHSSVSLLMSQGVDLRTIQTRIGHSTPRLTLSLYSHAMVSAKDAAVSVMDDVHRGIRESESSISGTISGTDPEIAGSTKNEIPQNLAG